ncbi:MAG: hypothetical protein NT062_20960, partial [Proteobacteria bacterium]|nr:hypothetical protein [Pseudomonadota bacterium]
MADDLVLATDKPSYRPGDVAKVEIRSRTLPAIAIVSFARDGVVAQHRVELSTASTIVDVPITTAQVPNLRVTVDRWARRAGPPTTGPLPAHAEDTIDLEIDVDSARLTMTAHPTQPVVQPGAEATFEVDVQRGGKAVANAEVALIVVDEAMLAMSNRRHADPLGEFYEVHGDGTDPIDTMHLVDDAGGDVAAQPGVTRYSLDAPGRGRAGSFLRGHTA